METKKNASSPLKFHIWDYSTTPPTDVTDADPDAKPDAEPEMVNWLMAWRIEDGFRRWESFDVDVRELTTSTYRNGDLRYAKASRRFPAGYTPTIHDLKEAMKPYNVQVPVPEEPQWHRWDRITHEWGSRFLYTTNPAYGIVDPEAVWIFGTTSDRDEKRDAFLEAAQKAGKKP